MTEVININAVGQVTYWNLCGESDLNVLFAGFSAEGLGDYIPEIPTEVTSLKEAAESLYACREEQATVLVRPLQDRANDGFVVVRETKGREQNHYENLLTVRIEGSNLVRTSQLGLREVNPDDLVDAFKLRRSSVSGQALGKALVKIVDHLGGVSLRPMGAIYWLPESALAAWNQVSQIVALAARDGKENRIYGLRTIFDASSIVAIRDAICHEIDSTLTNIEKRAEGGGQRALFSRKAEAQALYERVQSYETILGESLDTLRSSIQKTEVYLAEAILMTLPDVFEGLRDLRGSAEQQPDQQT